MDSFPTKLRRSKSERFYCPYPGCTRSFIDLWRLKVHYRADPDVRGSGRERGHGKELPACPKCRKILERGRHHVNCAAGKAAPSQTQRRLNKVCRQPRKPLTNPNANSNCLVEKSCQQNYSCNCCLEPRIHDTYAERPMNMNSIPAVRLAEPLFQQTSLYAPCRIEQREQQPLPTFNCENGCCYQMNEMHDMNIKAGYAVFLRPNPNSEPQVYFVPGETVEVSVKDPFLNLDQKHLGFRG